MAEVAARPGVLGVPAVPCEVVPGPRSPRTQPLPAFPPGEGSAPGCGAEGAVPGGPSAARCAPPQGVEPRPSAPGGSERAVARRARGWDTRRFGSSACVCPPRGFLSAVLPLRAPPEDSKSAGSLLCPQRCAAVRRCYERRCGRCAL